MAHAQAYRRGGGRMPHAPTRRQGSWKLAYADFLTALVALFLVLWLVKGVPGEDRAELASYFSGTDAAATVAATSQAAPDTATFTVAALRDDPRLADFSDRLQLMSDAGSVRVDVVDRLDDPLFGTDSAELTSSGREVLEELAAVLAATPWPYSIEGHTDAFSRTGSGGDNWTLSSARAETARRVLLEAGLPRDRLRAVTGLAATRPLNAGEPHLAANRRVTLVLHVSG